MLAFYPSPDPPRGGKDRGEWVAVLAVLLAVLAFWIWMNGLRESFKFDVF